MVGGYCCILVVLVDILFVCCCGMVFSVQEIDGYLDILIIEDDLMIQNLYWIIIDGWKFLFKLCIVINCFDGFLQVGECVFDILIVDLMMFGLDGFEMICYLCVNLVLLQMDVIVVSIIDCVVIQQQELLWDVMVFGKLIFFYEIKGFVLGCLVVCKCLV